MSISKARRELTRDSEKGKIAGVCAGLGDYLTLSLGWYESYFSQG